MQEFREIICDTYPKLKDCGGFEMLRCLSNSRELQIITGKLAQSPKVLKTVIGTGRLYLRPIQKDLDISAVEDQEWESNEVISPTAFSIDKGSRVWGHGSYYIDINIFWDSK